MPTYSSTFILKRRTHGEKPQSLQILTGDYRYDPLELARPDNFWHPYVGKVYEKINEETEKMEVVATEVLTKGLEWIVSSKMHAFFDADIEHCIFIINLLKLH